MARRVVLGMLKGLLLGAVLAALMVAGLGVVQFGSWLWVPSACGLGLLAGLVTGKPIWAPAAKVEALLKGLVGALLAAGGLFALRAWVHVSLDLSALGAGSGPIGDLPAASLPVVAALLGAWFEADNTDAGASQRPRSRVEPAAQSGQAAQPEGDSVAEHEESRTRDTSRG